MNTNEISTVIVKPRRAKAYRKCIECLGFFETLLIKVLTLQLIKHKLKWLYTENIAHKQTQNVQIHHIQMYATNMNNTIIIYFFCG